MNEESLRRTLFFAKVISEVIILSYLIFGLVLMNNYYKNVGKVIEDNFSSKVSTNDNSPLTHLSKDNTSENVSNKGDEISTNRRVYN